MLFILKLEVNIKIIPLLLNDMVCCIFLFRLSFRNDALAKSPFAPSKEPGEVS